MEADVSYNDFTGTVAADIADNIGMPPNSDDMESIGKYLKLDSSKYKMVGLSFYGTKDLSATLICVDLEQSSEGNEYLVKISYDVDDKNLLDSLFKRLNFVLFDKYDKNYRKLDCKNSISFSEL